MLMVFIKPCGKRYIRKMHASFAHHLFRALVHGISTPQNNHVAKSHGRKAFFPENLNLSMYYITRTRHKNLLDDIDKGHVPP